MIDEWTASLTKLAEGSGEDEARATKAAEKLGGCIKELIETRVKVWCLSCGNSGHFDWFDDATSTIKVSKDTCKVIVDKCAGPLGFFKRLISVDGITRKIRKAFGGNAEDGAEPTLNVETSTEIAADTTCSDDAAGCAADDANRKSFCEKLALNKDSKDVFGDNNMFKTKPANFPTPSTGGIIRILPSDNSEGKASEQATGGMNMSELDAGYQGDAFGFAKLISTVSIIAIMVFNL